MPYRDIPPDIRPCGCVWWLDFGLWYCPAHRGWHSFWRTLHAAYAAKERLPDDLACQRQRT